MAGPQPQMAPNPAQPPYPPPHGAPQMKKKNNLLKGCIIAAVILAVLGLAAAGGCYFIVKKGVGMVAAETTAAEQQLDGFLAKLSVGDLDGAYSYCDPGSFTRDELQSMWDSYSHVLRGNTGVTYFKVMDLSGNLNMSNDHYTVTLNPASLNGKPGVSISAVLEKPPGAADYRLSRLNIMGAEPLAPTEETPMPEDQ